MVRALGLAALVVAGAASASFAPRVFAIAPTPVPAVAAEALQAACATMRQAARGHGLRVAAVCDAGGFRPVRFEASSPQPSLANGDLVARQRIAANDVVALDIVSYMSDGLVVGGLLCQRADGARRSTVIHVPGGAGGVFSGGAGNIVQTCIDWAALHDRTAFIPSLRGNDGGQGRPELCLGEANDVVAAVAMLRQLEVVEPNRVGLVGGSIGGCVVLKAAPYIPDLAAVVAFVPPTSWKDLITYHREAWQPATEQTCDGPQADWTIGGPEMADALESVICGHPSCSDDEFLIRSPLPLVQVQRAPTLIVSAESDNIVPLEQQLLWSLFRQGTGHPVAVLAVDPCDPPGTPPLQTDVHLLARDSFHLLAPGPISSGMLFLMGHLDARSGSF